MNFSSLFKPVSFRRLTIRLWAVATLCALAHTTDAATYYWDNNTTTAGFGTAGGTWSSAGSTLWNNDSLGGSVGSPNTLGTNIITTITDLLNFGTATDGLAAGTLTVTGTVSANSLTFGSASGAVLLSGGTISLGGTTPTITVNNAADTIDSAISGSAAITKAGTGTLTLGGNNTFTGDLLINGGIVNGGATNGRRLGSIAAGAGSVIVDGSTSVLNILTTNSFGANANTETNRGLVAKNGGTINTTNVNRIGNVTLQGGTLTVATSNSSFGGIYFGTVNTGQQATVTVSGGTGAFTNTASTISGAGSIALDTNTQFDVADVTGDANADLTVSANLILGVSNPNNTPTPLGAGFTKKGAGTMALTGTTANTYSGGTTTVTGGVLDLGKTAGVNAIGGNLTIGDGATTAGLDIVRLTTSNQIIDTSVITFNGTGSNAGILRLNNQSETLAGLSSTGGAGIVENESGSAATSTLTVNIASGTQTFSGILRNGDGTGTDGTLAFTKTGAGTQVLSGSSAYTGTTRVNGGTLSLTGSINGGTTGSYLINAAAGASLDISGSGSLTTTFGNARAIVVGGASGQSGTINVSGSGSLTTPGMLIGEDSGGTGLVNQTGGTVSIGASGLWMTGNSSTLTVSGGNFSAGTARIAVALSATSSTSAINVNGTGSMTLGTLRFGESSRNYTSATVNVGNFSTSSSVGGTIQVDNITYGGGTGASAINFDGGTFVANGTFSTLAAVPVAGATFSTVVKSGGANISVTGSNTLTIPTALTDGGGGGGLTKSNTGTLSLTGTDANTYTGTTIVNGGILALGKTAGINAIGGNLTIGDGATTAGLDIVRLTTSNQIADTSVVTFNGTGSNAGILRLNNQSETLAGLSSTGGAGIVENESGSASTGTLTVSFASGTQTFSGILRDGDGTGTDGTLALTKTGNGTQILTGANTYTGATTISGGSVILGSGTGTTGTGSVTVQTGSTILGTGTVKGSSFTAASGSSVHAGDSTAQSSFGTLTFTPVSGSGAIDFQSGSTTFLGINPGGTSDLINITGTGSNTFLFNGNLTVGPASFTPLATEVFNLIDWAGLAAAPTFDSRYTYAGLLSGNGDEASGLDLPDISGSGFFWDISQFTTNGSIAIVVVPEPSRALLLFSGLAGLLLRRRRGGLGSHRCPFY